MSVIKVTLRDKPYVCLSKHCLEQVDLSWGARGLHAYFISKPPNWQIKVFHLIKCSPHGKDTVYKLINELIGAGYIERIQERDPVTREFKGYDYIVYEEPEPKQDDSEIVEQIESGLSLGNEALKPASETSEPYSEHPHPDFPYPAKPDPAFPYPVKPTVINIDINNNKLNNYRAAASKKNGEMKPML